MNFPISKNFSLLVNSSLLRYCLFSLSCLAFACENSVEDLNKLNSQLKSAVETVKEVEILYSEEGQVRVKVEAKLMLNHKTKEPYTEFPDGIKVTFFDDNKRVSGTLKAKHGIRDERKQITTVRDSVVWKSISEKKILEGEELQWDEKKKEIQSDKYVKISTETETITGMGLRTDQEFTRYTIIEPYGEFDPPENFNFDSY